jgi:hypothetical protein
METKTITLSLEQWNAIDDALNFYGESLQDQIEFMDEGDEEIEELESEISIIDEIQTSIMNQSKNL